MTIFFWLSDFENLQHQSQRMGKDEENNTYIIREKESVTDSLLFDNC